MKEAISTANAPAAIGPYSAAIKSNGMLFISGQLGINPESGNIEGKTVEEQTEQVLKNVIAILNAAGLTAENVVKTTIFITDMDYYPKVNEVYAKVFPPMKGESGTPPPARSCFAVKGLPKNGMVEIETIAAFQQE